MRLLPSVIRRVTDRGIQTIRISPRRAKLALVRWVPTAVLGFVLALGALESELHPLPPGPPAALAVSAHVSPTSTATAAAPTAAAVSPADSVKSPQLATIDNPRVDSWVKKFTTSLKSEFGASLQRMSGVGTMIAEKLEARDMPSDLVYLAMIESEGKPTARSKVNAVGLWQFMSSTARQYGLKVTAKTDQRKDPAKETDAALTYLADLHDKFGSWYLAAAAYNAGAGAVERALKAVTGKTTGTDADFYRIASKLPAETRDYVPKLIAAATIGNDPQSFGFTTAATQN